MSTSKYTVKWFKHKERVEQAETDLQGRTHIKPLAKLFGLKYETIKFNGSLKFCDPSGFSWAAISGGDNSDDHIIVTGHPATEVQRLCQRLESGEHLPLVQLVTLARTLSSNLKAGVQLPRTGELQLVCAELLQATISLQSGADPSGGLRTGQRQGHIQDLGAHFKIVQRVDAAADFLKSVEMIATRWSRTSEDRAKEFPAFQGLKERIRACASSRLQYSYTFRQGDFEADISLRLSPEQSFALRLLFALAGGG
ncbi:hypothetical protein WJX72_003460 [[Myrmecia] bisecta]|uniref:Uncharacterized protein n=1 Tax=[Myrmecia] bisecta TaxID=41462 RepID=A0AAW1QB86_9CHLO